MHAATFGHISVHEVQYNNITLYSRTMQGMSHTAHLSDLRHSVRPEAESVQHLRLLASEIDRDRSSTRSPFCATDTIILHLCISRTVACARLMGLDTGGNFTFVSAQTPAASMLATVMAVTPRHPTHLPDRRLDFSLRRPASISPPFDDLPACASTC